MSEELFPEPLKPLECLDPETGDFVIGAHGWFQRSPVYGPDRAGKYWALYGDKEGQDNHCFVCVSSAPTGEYALACPPGDTWERKKRLPSSINRDL